MRSEKTDCGNVRTIYSGWKSILCGFYPKERDAIQIPVCGPEDNMKGTFYESQAKSNQRICAKSTKTGINTLTVLLK